MADLVTVTGCRDCDWPHGKTPSQAAANRHAKENGHTVVTGPRAVVAQRRAARDLQGEQDHAEFAGWMEAQGWYWTGTAYTRDDMAEAFLAGMQAARDLAEAAR